MSRETTELREKLNKLIIELDRLDITLDSPVSNMTLGEYEQEREKLLDGFTQAIAATLGRPKAKSHPYGYEPDTGAFDATRCKCGCINDISATYCNDCGGEIEIDMNAEKEIYHTPALTVFAEKHDDGSLEFGGKRYIAATLGIIDKGLPQGADGNLDKAQVDWLRLMPDGWDGTAPDTLGRGTCKATMRWVEWEGADGTPRRYRTSHYDTECGNELFWPGKLPPYCPFCKGEVVER